MSYTTNPTSSTTVVSRDDERTSLLNRVSWGAILAGVVVALVTQLILNVLGIGVGLSTLDATAGAADNPSASTSSIVTALWIAATGIFASFLGGQVAGRLAGSSRSSTAGWHGLVSWAATTLVLFYLLTTALGSLVGGAFNLVGSAAGGIGSAVSSAGSAAASAVPGAAGLADHAGQLTANLQNQVQGALNSNDPAAVRDSIVDYVRSSASGDQAAQNAARDRAVNALARTANITPEEARTRIDQLQTQYREAAAQAEQKARAAAETARSATSRASLLGVLALVLGAVASWFGGMSGVPRREMTATTTTARV